jgi:hypothetical protein
VYSQFQSNGLCQDHCQGSYAFAILQGYYCWCSNYIPSPQQNTLDCNQECPGFSEWCGNTDAGLYGYYLLSPGQPLGTSGSAGSATSSSSSPTSSVSILTSAPQSTSLLDPGSTTSRTSRHWTNPLSPSVVTPGSSQSSTEAPTVTSSSESSTDSTSSSVRDPLLSLPSLPSPALFSTCAQLLTSTDDLDICSSSTPSDQSISYPNSHRDLYQCHDRHRRSSHGHRHADFRRIVRCHLRPKLDRWRRCERRQGCWNCSRRGIGDCRCYWPGDLDLVPSPQQTTT